MTNPEMDLWTFGRHTSPKTRHRVFYRWLLTIRQMGRAHGSEVLDIPGANSLHMADVDSMLLDAEQAQVIQREGSRSDPTVSQGAFTGLSMSAKAYETSGPYGSPMRSFASHWWWNRGPAYKRFMEEAGELFPTEIDHVVKEGRER